MAFFSYEGEYTNKQLFDHSTIECSILSSYGLDSMAMCAHNMQSGLNKLQQQREGTFWIPVIPTQNQVMSVKQRMLQQCKKLVKCLERDGVREFPNAEETEFVGENSICPECKREVAHLKAHLTTKKHGWSIERYNRWKKSKLVGDKRPKKQCTMCEWRGKHLDMHVKNKHSEITKEEYREMALKQRKSSKTKVSIITVQK